MFRQNKLKIAMGFAVVTLAFAVGALAVAIAGPSTVDAKGFGGFDQATSAEDLKQARGVVDAYVRTEIIDPVLGQHHAVINGEWILKCRKSCAKAKLHDIEFDMSFSMRNPLGDDDPFGAGRHAHQMSDFSATSLTHDPVSDSLLIEGLITGSRHIGTNGVTIRLEDVGPGGNAKFYFQLTDPTSIVSEVGGTIVESKGGNRKDDDDDDD